MNGEISLLSALLWALASGLIGVGIGVTFMCVFFLAKKEDEAKDTLMKGSQETLDAKYWNQVVKELRRPWPSDLAKGKGAKTWTA